MQHTLMIIPVWAVIKTWEDTVRCHWQSTVIRLVFRVGIKKKSVICGLSLTRGFPQVHITT